MTTWSEQLAALGLANDARPGDDTRRAMAARRECEANGHRYRVHGTRTPRSVSCSRCRVAWAIGARTEPTS